ncbi:MAG: hypothetical protein ABR589_13655, partial [Chthoniobacterales bacterium]
YVLPLEANGKPRAFARAPGSQSNASFSPDGRHVVYQSNESGAVQIYVKPFPGPGVARQISYERGSRPNWSPDGRKIFFTGSSARVIMSANFDPATGDATEPQKHIDLAADIDSEVSAREILNKLQRVILRPAEAEGPSLALATEKVLRRLRGSG